MSSLSLRPQVHDALVDNRNRNSVISRTHSPGRSSTGWRSGTVWSQRRKLLCRRSDILSPDCRTNSLTSAEGGVRNISDPKLRFGNRHCADLQTDEEIRARNPQQNETNLAEKRNSPEARWRRRVASESYIPNNNRHFWDHSLKTRSIVINSRNPIPTPMTSQYHLSQAPPGVFPRLSRSAEGISGFEIPTRYPRGQQRPTGLASSHFALKLRHEQIVKVARHREVTWPQLRTNRLPEVAGRETTANQESRKRRLWNSTHYYDVTMQDRCSQQAREKCKDWFDTWVED